MIQPLVSKRNLPAWFAILVAADLATAATPLSPPSINTPPDIFGPGHVLSVGRVAAKVTNAGIIGNPFTNISADPSAQWPGASGIEYLNSVLFAVAAVDLLEPNPSLMRRVSYSREWGPATIDPADRIYDTFEGAINGWADGNDDGDYGGLHPLIDEDFLDGRDNDVDGVIDEDHAALGQQMFSCVMRDDGSFSEPPVGPMHLPLGLECRQRAWAYDVPGYTNVIVVEYTVINQSGHVLDSLSLGWRVDADAGPITTALYYTDDRDLPNFPSGEFVRALDVDDVRRQYPHHPSLNYDVPPDSALCPRVKVRINGFSFADDNGDAGATRGLATFLLLGHTVDPTGVGGPPRVGFRSFRRYLAGTPFNAGGNPINDLERFQLMSSTEGIDGVSGFISVSPSGVIGDQQAWCSIGPFRNVPDGGTVQATIAFAVQVGSYDVALEYESDYAQYESGALEVAELFGKHRTLSDAYNVQTLHDGEYSTSFGQPVPDFHGRETPLIAPLGGPPLFAADCRDLEMGVVRQVTDQGYTWFDFDCDYCTGVWDYPSTSGRFLRHWNSETVPLAVEPGERPVPDGAATGINLLTCAPNPMREGGRLEFALPRAARTRIEIRDLAGRIVRRLDDAARAPGTHQVSWDGRDDHGGRVAPGAYFWSVRTGDDSGSRMILVVR